MENISLTQRIVGAIVVLSLAIIFIPALLETDRLDPGKATDSPIPEVPREISTIVFQLNEKNGTFEGEGLNGEKLTASEQFAHSVNDEINRSENELILPSSPAEKLSVSALDATQINELQTESNEAINLASNKPDTATLTSDQLKGNQVVPPEVLNDGKQHSWMLQLASFKDEANAIKLRDSLRNKQYVAHVSERKFSSGSIWRVRIGPVLSKDKIVKLQSLLEKEMKLKGLIVRRR